MYKQQVWLFAGLFLWLLACTTESWGQSLSKTEDGFSGLHNGFYIPFVARVAQPADFTRPTHLAAADLNRDGSMDILSYSSDQGRFAWYPNQQQNGFGPLTELANGFEGMQQMVVFDYDRDGDADIFGLFPEDQRLRLWINTGVGNFLSASEVVSGAHYSAFTLSDMNADGRMDLILANQDNGSLEIHVQSSNRQFEQEAVIQGVGSVSDIAAIRANADGRMDIAVSQLDAGSVRVFIGEEGLIFTESVVVYAQNPANHPQKLLAEDYDGDGWQDLIVYDSAYSSILLFKNNASTFDAAVTLVDQVVDLSDWAQRDVEGDGDIDLIYADRQSGSISWLENLENSTFGRPQFISDRAVGASAVVSTDLNSDGLFDVAVASELDDRIVWHSNIGGRRFSSAQAIARLADIYRPEQLEIADFNNDGFNDILAVSKDEGRFLMYLNNESQAFDSLLMVADALEGVSQVEAMDLDQDGDTDLVYALGSLGQLAWLENNGSGIFRTDSLRTGFSELSAFAVCDVNGNGHVDAVVAEQQTGQIHLLAGTASVATRFTSIQTAIGSLSQIDKLSLADVNEDGRLDIVAASSVTGQIAVLIQQENQSFDQQTLAFTVLGRLSDLLTVDLDGIDGPDLLLSDAQLGRIHVLLNEGNGRFIASARSYTSLQGVESLHVVDLDGDQDQDVLAALSSAGQIVWLENSVGVLSQPQVIYDQAPEAMDIVAGDLDGDLIPDIASVFRLTNDLSWFRNGLAQRDGSNRAPRVIANFADAQATSRPYTYETPNSSFYFEDPDNNPLQYSIQTDTDDPRVQASVSQEGVRVAVAEGFLGLITVTVTATDGNLSASDQFQINSVEVNLPPRIVAPIADVELELGWEGFTIAQSLANVFEDPEGQALSFSITAFQSNQILAAISGNQILLQEVNAFVGTTTVEVTATDPGGESTAERFNVRVLQPNRPPILEEAIPSQSIVLGNSSYSLFNPADFFTDPDGQDLTFEVTTTSSLFSIAIAEEGQLRLEPSSATSAGKASFVLKASDGQLEAETEVNVWLRFGAPVITFPAAGDRPNRAFDIVWEPKEGATRQELRLLQIVSGDTSIVFQDVVVPPQNGAYQSPVLEYSGVYTVEIRAVDSEGNAGVSAFRPVRVVAAPSASFTRGSLLPTLDLADSSYRMLSLPGSYSFVEPELIFGAAGSKNRDWVAYEWLTDTQNFVQSDGQAVGVFRPGNALWYLLADTVDLSYEYGPPVLNDQDEVEIELQPGWNVISSSFLTENLDWSLIQRHNQIESVLWRYNNGWQQANVLAPFEGYYLFAEEAGTLRLPYGKRVDTGPVNKVNREQLSFRIAFNDQLPAVEVTQGGANSFHPKPYTGMESKGLWLVNGLEDQQKAWKSCWTESEEGLMGFKTHYMAESSQQLEVHYEQRYGIDWALLVYDERSQQSYRSTFESGKAAISLPPMKGKLKWWIGDSDLLDQLEQELLPASIEIRRIYPNPFNPSTQIQFSLNQQQHIQVEVFNTLGQRVAILFEGSMPSGSHNLGWNASQMASGVYILRIQSQSSGKAEVRKLSLIK